jgi:hypothetical protein
MPRLFLSYHTPDLPAVVAVRQQLSAAGIDTFIASDLTPGLPWFDELDHALTSVDGAAVFLGPHGIGTIQQREMWFGLQRQAAQSARGTRYPVIPVLLPGSDQESLSGFLSLNTWIDLRVGVVQEQIDRLVRSLVPSADVSATDASPAICPYRGLSVFREQDAPVFFGREAFAAALQRKLETERFVAVVGPSGSGKSSVVQGGAAS